MKRKWKHLLVKSVTIVKKLVYCENPKKRKENYDEMQ